MNVAVLGTWHLGSVIAACAAAAGHQVIGWDPDASAFESLKQGRAPISEPGLDALVASGLASGRLEFTGRLQDAVVSADVVWLAFDTPVDDEDRADVEYVIRHATATFPYLKDGTVVLSSSQLPVGSMARLERAFAQSAAARRVSFACSPENLRLGKAIDVFTNPDRVVVGVRDDRTAKVLQELFAPITERLERMSVESAEMTKHAINAFLATSVAFINEIAALCERAGADAKEVERGLKSEKRIGPYAYLGPGTAFAGGTLARDVVFLRELGRAVNRTTPLMDGVEASNLEHRNWARRRLESMMAPLAGRTIAVWGLTYKPGTDTLRRSTAVELCRWLMQQGVHVRVHDPAASALPADLVSVSRFTSAREAATGADALVIATEWPEYRDVDLDILAATLKGRIVVDGNRFLGATVGRDARFTLISVGAPDASDNVASPGS
jgi:UDPglucose 6-dehydrogenase